ncbi:hypothetical protein ROZALSC1DRAFT_31388 [Rozella allomycis CSF55]|uniref:Uncharacterized protein n=1 Tax=Rozella allomycis (strain CSF55) TaxID=988480 RepID=A0A4P9YD03_ROZAC|nr:hypothetical protein ROZALSC1DRAFT_31388 [Rozella allomycis CSF55]
MSTFFQRFSDEKGDPGKFEWINDIPKASDICDFLNNLDESNILEKDELDCYEWICKNNMEEEYSENFEYSIENETPAIETYKPDIQLINRIKMELQKISSKLENELSHLKRQKLNENEIRNSVIKASAKYDESLSAIQHQITNIDNHEWINEFSLENLIDENKRLTMNLNELFKKQLNNNDSLMKQIDPESLSFVQGLSEEEKVNTQKELERLTIARFIHLIYSISVDFESDLQDSFNKEKLRLFELIKEKTELELFNSLQKEMNLPRMAKETTSDFIHVAVITRYRKNLNFLSSNVDVSLEERKGIYDIKPLLNRMTIDNKNKICLLVMDLLDIDPMERKWSVLKQRLMEFHDKKLENLAKIQNLDILESLREVDLAFCKLNELLLMDSKTFQLCLIPKAIFEKQIELKKAIEKYQPFIENAGNAIKLQDLLRQHKKIFYYFYCKPEAFD